MRSYVSLCVCSELFSLSGQLSIVFVDHRFLAFFENIRAVEIDEDTLWFLKQFHVGKELRFMNR